VQAKTTSIGTRPEGLAHKMQLGAVHAVLEAEAPHQLPAGDLKQLDSAAARRGQTRLVGVQATGFWPRRPILAPS
jgi:hypothetical protein